MLSTTTYNYISEITCRGLTIPLPALADVPLPFLDPSTGYGLPADPEQPAAGSGAAFARARRGGNGRVSFMLASVAGRHAGPAPKHLRLQSTHSRINEGEGTSCVATADQTVCVY